MSLKEAEDLAADILKQVMEDKIDDKNVEMALISTKTMKFEMYDDNQIKGVIGRLQTTELDAAKGNA